MARVVKRSDIERCPRRSFSAAHYRDDGSCLCTCFVHDGGLRLVDAPGRCNLYDAVRRCEFEIGRWDDAMLERRTT